MAGGLAVDLALETLPTGAFPEALATGLAADFAIGLAAMALLATVGFAAFTGAFDLVFSADRVAAIGFEVDLEAGWAAFPDATTLDLAAAIGLDLLAAGLAATDFFDEIVLDTAVAGLPFFEGAGADFLAFVGFFEFIKGGSYVSEGSEDIGVCSNGGRFPLGDRSYSFGI